MCFTEKEHGKKIIKNKKELQKIVTLEQKLRENKYYSSFSFQNQYTIKNILIPAMVNILQLNAAVKKKEYIMKVYMNEKIT